MGITFCRYRQLNDQTVLFLTIQFRMMVCSQFKCQIVLFESQIGLQARVNPGAMAMKGHFAFPKAPALLEPHHQIVLCYIYDTSWRGVCYPSAEMQLVYSTAPTDEALEWCVTPLQRCNWCTLQPQLTRLESGVLPLCRDAIGVLYSPNWLGSRVVCYPSAEMQLEYSTAPTD